MGLGLVGVVHITLGALARDGSKRAQEILDTVGATLKDASAILVESEWSVTAAKGESKLKIMTLAKRPNLLRFTTVLKGAYPELMLFDGKTCWTYDADANEFSKAPQSAYTFSSYVSFDLLREIYFKGASRLLFRAHDVKVTQEKLGTESCQVVSWARKVGQARIDYTKLWIDSRNLVRRAETKSVSADERSETLMNYKKVDLNPDLSKDPFTFRPKEGAKEIKESSPEEDLLPAGTLAPDFEAVDVEGRKVKLSAFKGKVVLLNFWFYD